MSRQKNLKRNLLICLLAGSAVMYTLPLHAATSVVANNALPNFDKVMSGALEKNPVISNNGLTMDITQTSHNAVIKWNSFDVGGSATVNFWGPDKHNTLNYVNSANMSQIYGTINANNNGNIFIVNPAGVQIGPSAQINVGSLYVSNSRLSDDALKAVEANNKNFDFNTYMNNNGTHTDAALMSLGNINATNVTFEGDGRIVIDSERLINGNNSMGAANINIKTKADNTGNVIIGYEAYDEENKKYTVANDTKAVAIVNGTAFYQDDAYMWVEDVEQLQAIDTNLSGNYALRNSIDATATKNWNNNKGFSSIGVDATGKTNGTGFTGKFDGIDYNIFGLTIDRDDETNVGLFGAATDAAINNVTLVGGSINGSSNVGAIVGAAEHTTISNVTNSAKVEGDNNVGGIVGIADNTTVENAINTGIVDAAGYNIGGLIGYMNNSNLGGNSYNLGDVSGTEANVGGLVGHAVNSAIGNPSVVNGKPVENVQVVYNRLNVKGAYNVGGIVGNMKGTTVQNAENSGNVTATGYETEKYIYNTANTDFDKTHGENNDGVGGVEVNVANVGGIAGISSNSSTIENVTNTGNVNSNADTYEPYGDNHTYYTAGNVGGVVGRAENTNITNATNRENEVRGAHNVGGVAGYFGGIGTVDGGINDGGDIMATGARAAAGVNGNVVNEAGFAREQVRPGTVGDETFIIGNMGGVVGYMDGDNVYVTGSANRGTVHSEDITDPGNILYISQAANTGGIVGKINRNKITDGEGNILTNEAILAGIKEGSITAAVTDSYNTGDVTGYSGVGGVVGMMYNGEVADSYNLGSINTTRKPKGGDRTSVNMGGVVGDTTEGSGASAVIYNVYNKGQIGDEDYETYARHVGGIVGRLSGIVDKSYNTGAIYNGYSVVGGIAGWFYEGTISNSFNTGNITVNNKETLNSGTQVGGIVGGIGAYNGSNKVNAIYNAYNLGTIRSFNDEYQNSPNNVGGIVGKVVDGGSSQSTAAKVEIKNVYTISNIYSSDGNGAGSIYGNSEIGNRLTVDGANYIELENSEFTNLDNSNPNVNKVYYKNRYNSTAYNFVELNTGDKIWADVDGANVSEDGYWRIYNNGDGTGTTPILNAFLPNAEDYFSGETDAENPMDGISSIQYGTAYDPLLTIIKANEDLTFDWGALGIQNDGGLAVYNAGLTLTDFKANGGTGYFGGIIYADESLNLKGTDDIGLGSASQIYGSDVTISTDGKVTIYGDITATGNQKDGNTTGSITINAGDVDVYGTLTSAKDGVPTKVSGIAQGAVADFDFGDIKDKDKAVTDIGNRFAVDVDSSVTGNIIINAGTKVVTGDDGKSETVTIGDGNVNLYYGNKQEGLITTGGDLTVTGTGDVYVDSDLDIGGDLTLTGNGANSEVVLDITNVGQVQADNGTVSNALEGFHNFMHHFGKQDGDGANINLKAEKSKDTKITVDMWDGKTFNLKKFDSNGHDFKNELDSMNVTINGNKLNGTEGNHVKDYTYIWVSDGEQLQGINNTGADGLDFNYALKGDINASDVQGYEAIGGTTGFTGTFDGRGNRVIGLTVNATDSTNNKTNAGIFSTVGEGGVVKNVNIYSGNFTGTDNAGAVAGMNSGRIENVTGFGNTVTVTGDTNNAGNAGGIVGVNNGTGTFNDNNDSASTLIGYGIYDVQSIGSVIAGNNKVVAGGLVGTNNGSLGNSYSDSAVTSTAGTTEGLGGVVGVNTVVGNVQYVDSLGVTNGGTNSNKVGGIIGVNNGNMYSGYNESIVTGNNNVGGIIGVNSEDVTNIVNATGVEGHDYVGGLIGDNAGNVTDGRNNGTITGNEYVGGMVGSNADGSQLKNLTNGESADITGENYVGGIAGTNAGTITAQNQANLINRGSITGQNYVGGVAGENIGTIEYVKNDVSLNVKDSTKEAAYFGGVAGINGRVDDENTSDDESATGTITSATNEGNVIAVNADYVGGIVGHNTVNGVLDGMGNSNDGRVEGATYVGGVAGKNDAAITGTVDDMVGIANNGIVIAHKGGAGGIFGENTGNIEYAELTNNGIVSGTYNADKVAGTGGLIGVNSGNIIHSSLKNNIGGQVIGTQNVGGLIGVNTGNIEGGRNEQEVDKDGNETVAADSYYKYQIYNNGTITVNGSGTNIGGLFGTNSGKVEAAYNTGAINASGSENVGGIAGTNSGTLDQVFNTVMVADGATKPDGSKQETAITGGTNVGGLVGINSGTLSNAYNTTEVKSTNNGVVGNAVGLNDGTDAKVNFVYDVTNTDNKLVGINRNNATITGSYTSANAEKSANGANGITYISADKANDKNSYGNFADDGTWKFYDGQQTPLLSVFLTKVKIDQDKVNEYMSAHKVYNGTEQKLTADDIKALINNGAIYVEGLTKEQAFEAFCNNNNLISSVGYKNVGEHSNWLYSDQIAAGSTDNSFNPNNLGYDIELKASLSQAELSISDILANIVYGGHIYTDIQGGVLTGDYYEGDEVYLTINGMPVKIDSDFISQYLSSAYKAAQNGRDTANVKRDQANNVIAYEDAIFVDVISLGGAAAGNYKLESNSISGDITVTPASLNITLNDIYRIYGDHNTIYGNYEATQSGNYGIKDVTGLVNGDENSKNSLIVTATSDGALDNFVNPTKTSDVKEDGYTWSGSFSGIDNVNSNYTITIEEGNSFVKAKTITIKDLLATIVYGNQGGNGFVLDSNSKLDLDGLAYNDNVTIDGNAVYNVIANSAYYNELKGRDTADVGKYEDSLSVSGITLSGEKARNYNLDTTAAVGDIEVTQATLNVTFNDVEHIYGNAGLSNGTSYGVNDVTGIVNSDNEEDINNSLSFVFVDGSDTALTGSTGRVTNDVGTGYEYQGTVNTTNNNYKVVVNGTNSNTGIGKSEVTKATVQINLDDITHVYGQPSDDYKIKDDIIWVNGDAYSVNDIVITDNTVDDDAIDKTTGKTNNAGGQYKWNASVDASGNNAEIINKNYNFEVVEGNSYVDQAELTINLGDITHTYGEPNKNGYNFTANGWVYGEDYSGDISIGSLGSGITDNALKDNNEHTNNANTAANPYYTWTTKDYSISGEGAVNYKITVVNDGKSYVDKANLVITADDANTTIGNMPDRFTGTDIQEQLVNGDIISDDIYHYGVSADTDVNVAGEHNIGIYINGTYYELQNPDWSSENGLGFFANYNVTFEPGTLTVSAYDIPEDWPHNRWNYLFNDAPFDRNKDFRERKAEVNFVDGGMEI